MKNLTQLPWSGKGSKAKNDNTLGRMRGGIRSRIGSMSLKNTSLFGVILTLLLTFGVGEMKAATIFNCGIDVNDTWYKGTGTINSGNWLGSKTAFNGANLGALTSMTLGGQYDTWDNNQTDQCSWNGNNGIHILIKKGSTQIASFKLTCYHDSKDGNNNVWKTKGGTGSCSDSGSWGTYTVDISGYAAGNDYTIKATWTSPSSQSNNATANFTINPVVTFKANGGTGSDYTQRVTYNTNTALTANTFTKTGYDFAGWATSADGDVVYAGGANVKLTAHTNLFAKWTAKTTTITLNNQDATTSGSTSVTATYGEDMPAITLPTKTGYTFGGYWGAPSGSGPKYYNADGSSNATWLNTESTYTLYAAWAENKSTVTLVASPSGKGTFQVGGATVTSTQAGVATTPEVTAVPIAGYSFTGWSITGGASISSTTDNPTTVTGGGAGTAATLTATFVEDIKYYRLKFNTRSGETDNGSVAAKDGSDNPLTSNTEYLSGTSVTVTATPADDYKFDSWYHGWSTGSSFSTVNPLTFTLSEATNVYAHFVQKTTSITLNKNGGSGGTAGPVTAAHGSTTLSTNPLVNPAKSNYTFTGYWTESSGGTKVIDTDGTLVASVSGYTKSGNKQWDYDDPTLTLYAQYSENKSTVTVTANETSWGTLKFASTSKSWGSTASVGVATSQNITATASSGYVFHNWELSGGATTSSDLTGTTITLKGTGSGEAGTAKANFGVASGWHMEGQDFGGWGGDNCSSLPTTTQFTYPYRGMANVYYVPLTLTKDHYFKVHHGNGCSNVFNFGTNSADVTVAKGIIYSLTADASHSGKVSSTLSNVWAVVNTSTNKFWVQDQQTFHNVNVTNEGNGTKGTYKVTLETTSAFTKGSNVFETTQFASGETFTVTVTGVSGYIPTITINGTPTTWWKEQAAYTVNGTMSTSDIDVSITYTASRAITFAKTTGCKTLTATGPSSTSVTTGTVIKDGTSITFAQTASTGYSFSKWYSTSTGEGGTQYSTADSYTLTTSPSANTIYPIYTLDSYTITLDKQTGATGYGSSGTAANPTATYNAVLPAISGTMPAGTGSYGFMGFYTGTLGTGLRLTDASGTWIASVEGYTDADKKWIHAGDVTLYAYYKQAEISDLTPAPAIIAPGETVTVTPTLSPAPEGTHIICWELQYSNGTALPSQPTFTPGVGNAVSFPAPAASATYRIQATLRSGSSCGGGSVLSTRAATFQVAGDHTVTVQYKCGDMTIAESVELDEIKPLIWSDDITAPSITGYTFSGWVAGDGVTIKDGEDDGTTSAVSTIKIKATYDGTLTANYTRKRMIYFYNTLDWENVYVYFYKNDSYWQTVSPYNGSGANQTYSWTNTPYSEGKHGQMQPVSDGSKIYYFDAEAEGVPENYPTVVFTKDNQHGYNYFYNTKAVKRDDYASTTMPMFVPLADQTPDKHNGTDYYFNGYWMNYPANTGYTLKIYNWYGDSEPARTYTFPYSADLKMPLKLDVEFNNGEDFWISIYRNDGVTMGKNYEVKQDSNDPQIITETADKLKVITSTPGTYSFTLSYTGTNYYIDVDYPAAVGDYRILYKDNATWAMGAHDGSWEIASDVINKNNGSEAKNDTVSFFVSKGDGISVTMKFQKITNINGSTGVVTWGDVAGGSISIPGSITEAGVYNFIVSQPAGGSSISLEKVEPYTGNYYIRTDCAGNTKWNNYKTLDHHMTYSDYAAENSGFTHYYAHWVTSGTNVKFCIANDYSMCLTEHLSADYGTTIANINGDGNLLSGNASIRFMYNQSTNKISRAYISGSSDISDRFLVLEGDAKMYDENGNALTTAGGGKISGLNDNEMNLIDDENFVYERTIQVNTQARAKLTAKYNNNVQYFIGGASETVELLGGAESPTKYTMRIVYDFKTNRLVTAYMPSDAAITENLAINADIMLVREHQNAGQQLTFDGGSLSKVKTVYGVMRFNRWTLNNKSTAAGHAPVGDPKSTYERSLYWISFPFDVNLSDVFGFGTYGTHWIIEYYDGAERATEGYWKDSEGFWKYITNRRGVTLKAGKGYILALDLDLMRDNNETFWAHEIQQVELFFPSAAAVENIEKTDTEIDIPAHECTIAPRPGQTDDRTKKDSHWNIIGVPSYANYGETLKDGEDATITWNDDPKTKNLPFLYEWNTVDNSYSVQSGTTYPFKSMHAYMVQYNGKLKWSLASATPVSPVVARHADAPQDVEFRLELQAGEKVADQTFVKMTTDEQISTAFDFNYDLSKQMNSGKANIYTMVEGYIQTAGNCLPMREHTTVVPVGVKIAADGDYTFAIPDGTEGVGVTLIDQETGIRTSLSALAYTVTLEAGTYDERFVLEISPIHNVPTEQSAVRDQQSDVRKVLIDGLLYIVRDNKMYDARGAMVMEK